MGGLPPHAGAGRPAGGRRETRSRGLRWTPAEPEHPDRFGRVGSPEMFAVVMAGGSGTRLWPLSRRRTPKQLLPLTGETSLLQQTVARITPLLAPRDIYVITAAGYVRETVEQLPQLPEENVLASPWRARPPSRWGWPASSPAGTPTRSASRCRPITSWRTRR